jgi:general secretion pathway protein D
MKKLSTLLIGFALLCHGLPASAEDVTLNFSDADLVAVINSVSQITGKNFIIDPRVKGKINVVSSKPLNADEVYNDRERDQDHSRRNRETERDAVQLGEPQPG